jgi:hypothetical protein
MIGAHHLSLYGANRRNCGFLAKYIGADQRLDKLEALLMQRTNDLRPLAGGLTVSHERPLSEAQARPAQA